MRLFHDLNELGESSDSQRYSMCMKSNGMEGIAKSEGNVCWAGDKVMCVSHCESKTMICRDQCWDQDSLWVVVITKVMANSYKTDSKGRSVDKILCI